MKKILFINHSSSFGGAQRSLYEYMTLIDRKKFDLYILSPKQSNTLLKEFNFIEFNFVPQLYNGLIGGYNGIRRILIIREIIYFVLFFFYCFWLKLTYKKFDLIHFNEITLLPCLIIKLFFNCSVSSHIRSKQNTKKTLMYKIFLGLIKKFVWRMVAIDNDVYETSYYRNNTIICKNFLNTFKNKKKIIKKKSKFIISYVGTLIKYKGISNLIKIASKFKKNNKIQFFVFGNIPKKNLKFFISKFFSNPYVESSSINLPNIFFFGEKNSLEEIYRNSDLVIFCSNINAVGRPVMEAAIFKKTSIVFLDDIKTDYIINKRTGFIIKNKNINEAVKKINYLHKNEKIKENMGMEAFKFIKKNFSIKKNYNIFKNEILLKI